MVAIVIVKDNKDIAGLYERVFAKYETCILFDMPEAIGYLQHACPDLLILDFHLPSGSGLSVLKYMRLRPSLKEVPVLAISADDMLRGAAKQEGVTAFLAKPFRIGELTKLAEQLMGQSRKAPTAEMRAVLLDYTDAYQSVYQRLPTGQWTGTHVLIDGQLYDDVRLRAEVRRLRSLTIGGRPQHYLHRLIDKLRRL